MYKLCGHKTSTTRYYIVNEVSRLDHNAMTERTKETKKKKKKHSERNKKMCSALSGDLTHKTKHNINEQTTTKSETEGHRKAEAQQKHPWAAAAVRVPYLVRGKNTHKH